MTVIHFDDVSRNAVLSHVVQKRCLAGDVTVFGLASFSGLQCLGEILTRGIVRNGLVYLRIQICVVRYLVVLRFVGNAVLRPGFPLPLALLSLRAGSSSSDHPSLHQDSIIYIYIYYK